jgi:hypothetical protein
MSNTVTPSSSSAYESETVNPMEDETPDASIEEAHESKSRRSQRGLPENGEQQKSKYRWTWGGNKPKRPIPERFSLPLIIYWFKIVSRTILHVVSVDWRFTNPQLTRIDDLMQRKRAAKRKLKRYSRFRRRTIAVFNSKGGAGKSPTIAHLLASVRKIMGLIPLLIDMNQNFGKTLINLLRPGASLGMKEAIERSDEFSDEFLDRNAGLSARGKVQIIVSEDIDDQIIVSEDIDDQREKYRVMVDRIKAVATQAGKFRKLIGIDTGNGMSHPANQAAMEVADALLFVGLWTDKEALGGIGDTIWGYYRRKFLYKISQKGFVVIVGVPPKLTKQQVFARLGEEIFQAMRRDHEKVKDPEERSREIAKYMQTLCIKPERLFIIPFSKHIAKRSLISGKTKVIGLAAKVAYMELMVAIYELESLKDALPENIPESFEEAFRKLVDDMGEQFDGNTSIDDTAVSLDPNHPKEVAS